MSETAWLIYESESADVPEIDMTALVEKLAECAKDSESIIERIKGYRTRLGWKVAFETSNLAWLEARRVNEKGIAEILRSTGFHSTGVSTEDPGICPLTLGQRYITGWNRAQQRILPAQ